MQGQRNYTSHVGQDPACQQRSASLPPPPPFHHGPLPPQPQINHQGHPPLHLGSRTLAYQHTLPSAPHVGAQPPTVSSGTVAAHPYLTYHQPPQVHANTQIPHYHPTSEQQCLPRSQRAHQLPPRPPFPAASAHPLQPFHDYSLERGLSHQTPSHAPSPSLSIHSSHPSYLRFNPFGSSVPSAQKHSVGPLPPPAPPPPTCPPGVPPLPPYSPPLDNMSRHDGRCILKDDLSNRDGLMLEGSPHVKPAEGRSIDKIEVPYQFIEKNGGMESANVVAHSPTDSDMEMEDDITQLDQEKQNCLYNDLDGECIVKSQEDCAKPHLQDRRVLCVESSALNGNRGGTELRSDLDIPITSRVCSQADDSSMTENKQTEQPFDVCANVSSSQPEENFSQCNVSVVSAKTGDGKLSGGVIDGADPFKLLQTYASDHSSENEGENLPGNVSPSAIQAGSTNLGIEGSSFGSELKHKNSPESDKNMLCKSKNGSSIDERSFATRKVRAFCYKSHRDSAMVGTNVPHQPKDSSRNCDANIGLEGTKDEKPGTKSNSTKLELDEFGRLVREGVSDSETSDSPRYSRRHVRRSRKWSRSRSRSRSPYDRRRRSPRRRKERRGRSRSLSPKRRRSRSRSPVSEHGNELNVDKVRREKVKVPECFDFRRGKCYRGATCRYSHHESDKSDCLRYSRDKQQYDGMRATLRSPDLLEDSKVPANKVVKDKGPRPSQDMPGFKEVEAAKEPRIDPTTHFPDKLNCLECDVAASNISDYSAPDMPSGNRDSLGRESAEQYSDKTLHFIDRQDKRMKSFISDSSSLAEASAATSLHLPVDKSDTEQGFTCQFQSADPITKPYSTEEVASQSLKELSCSIANNPSQLPPPLPSASQSMTVASAHPIMEDYYLMPLVARSHSAPESAPLEEPVSYQHSLFPGPSNTLSTSFPLPQQPPHSNLSVSVTSGEHGIPSRYMQHSLLPPLYGLSSNTSTRANPNELPDRSQSTQYQAYPSTTEPYKMPCITEDFRSSSLQVSNLASQQGGPYMMREDYSSEHPVRGMNPLQTSARPQGNSLLMQSPSKGMHCTLGVNFHLDSDSSKSRPSFQPGSYGLQYSESYGLSGQLTEPGKVSSSMSVVAPDFLDRTGHSYAHGIVGSRISNHFNPYASTFDLPLSSKLSSDILIHEKETPINAKYGDESGFSSVAVVGPNTGSADSKNMITLPSSACLAESALRPDGDQYDPLFDSFEPAPTLYDRSRSRKQEITADSDNMPRCGSVGIANMEDMKYECDTALSANGSLEDEEYGETADAEIGAVLNESPSNPNDSADMNTREIEIDQVKASEKKKGKDSRSMKLFKASIATFVKEVLKPSWRQGNMSKEVFKTIVKKTVDKVSRAMKSHHIPKSQAKISHYIDSSRGKLTKLVMGYVQKYVKV